MHKNCLLGQKSPDYWENFFYYHLFVDCDGGSQGDVVLVNLELHYENLPMQYTEVFWALKMENFQLKIFDSFLIFASKHRLWVHVRTALPRRF